MNEIKAVAEAALASTPDRAEVPPASGENPAAPASADAWDKVRELAVRQLDRFMSFEPKVLRGNDPDAIHDIRVASRRLQEILNLQYPRPRSREVRRLRRQIRRSRRALGEVRNCDALLERVETLLSRKRAARRETWTAFRHYLLERRADNFQKALSKYGKLNLAVFYVHLKDCLTASGGDPSLAPTPGTAAPEGPSVDFYQPMAEELRRVSSAFEQQIALSHREPNARTIHGARIATKRLRYLVEVIHDFDVPGSAEALAWLRELQQQLGDWHDLQVMEVAMIDMIARPKFLREHLQLAMGMEKLIIANRKEQKRCEEKYLQRVQGEFKRLKEWAAHLVEFPSAAFTRV